MTASMNEDEDIVSEMIDEVEVLNGSFMRDCDESWKSAFADGDCVLMS